MRFAVTLTIIAAAAIIPLFAGEFWVTLMTQIMIFGLLALSADLLLGNAGLFSLCHASFFAIAAYATAILQVRHGVPTIIAAPAGDIGRHPAFDALRLLRAHPRRLLHPHHPRVRLYSLGSRISLGLIHGRRQWHHERALPLDRRLRASRTRSSTTILSSWWSCCAWVPTAS